MCTLYAFKTRNVPENFNEAKFIGFTMYTTLVIWIAFVVIYLSSEHKVTTLSLCISFSALFALFLLFFPRCYIILFKPEKNNRSYFTTIKNVRCHIGYQVPAQANSSSLAITNQSGAPLAPSANGNNGSNNSNNYNHNFIHNNQRAPNNNSAHHQHQSTDSPREQATIVGSHSVHAANQSRPLASANELASANQAQASR